MRRYETRSTMMTSNRPLEDWGKLVGDVPAATAILDRFLHHAEVITIAGKSYRLRNKTGRESKGKAEVTRSSRVSPGSRATMRFVRTLFSERGRARFHDAILGRTDR